MCHFFALTIFFSVIFLTLNVFATPLNHTNYVVECNSQLADADVYCVDSRGEGYVCANTDPGTNTCTYACHSDVNCKTDVQSYCDNTTDINRPHWLCTCSSYWDCFDITGYCGDDGHCHELLGYVCVTIMDIL